MNWQRWVVMAGDALVLEHERLQQRMNQLFDKLEAALRQCLRNAAAGGPATPTPDADAQVTASVLAAFTAGRLQRFARSGFRRAPALRWAPRCRTGRPADPLAGSPAWAPSP